MMRMQLNIASLASLLWLSTLFVPSVANARDYDAYITWVIDGDSIRFEYRGKDGKTVSDECRMLHYNAPEMTGSERPEGKKASKKLISLIARKKVKIWGEKRDRYGRLLCEARLLDGTYINDVMREFLKDFPRRDIYLWKERAEVGADKFPPRCIAPITHFVLRRYALS